MRYAPWHAMRHGLRDGKTLTLTLTLTLAPTLTPALTKKEAPPLRFPLTRYDEGKISPTQLFETVIEMAGDEMGGTGAPRATKRVAVQARSDPPLPHAHVHVDPNPNPEPNPNPSAHARRASTTRTWTRASRATRACATCT